MNNTERKDKRNLVGMGLNELQSVVSSLGMPGYTAKQLAEWLYVKQVDSFAQMTNISLKFRKMLDENFVMELSLPVKTEFSVDGVSKHLFKVSDSDFVESVFIPEENRATLCLSCQVGCKMGCHFCMTGKQGFTSSLSAGQILNQILSLPNKDKLTNVVFMGMGEPLDNLNQILKVVEILTASYAFAWSPKRITISTVGLRRELKRLLDETKCHIAISLHASTPEKRAKIIPAEKAFSIIEMIEILKRHDFSRQRRLSFEYILFKEFNDGIDDMKNLVKLLNGLSCRVNLIRFHAIPGVDLKPVSYAKMLEFRDYMTQHGVFTTIRASRGEDILAACGMLSTADESDIF
ncbi:MAG TPA: 23S rRNA (adenine(2503)-C(2))-methyltransferase RlmN [Bacteroidaceae bacterium]|nr:23S rRNA (adenine(2503)-C(2))-methyltransferase RlmN [Bacteroidaceae bacterium]